MLESLFNVLGQISQVGRAVAGKKKKKIIIKENKDIIVYENNLIIKAC
jgi:hypothetical protein